MELLVFWRLDPGYRGRLPGEGKKTDLIFYAHLPKTSRLVLKYFSGEHGTTLSRFGTAHDTAPANDTDNREYEEKS